MKYCLNSAYEGPLPTSLSVRGRTLTTDENGVVDVGPDIAKILNFMKEWTRVGAKPRSDTSRLSFSDKATATITREKA